METGEFFYAHAVFNVARRNFATMFRVSEKKHPLIYNTATKLVR